ncbi:MAG TPA: aldehyde dehydrogenase [Vicinamibacterales bacterium]|nr:aldehyde dehydrogenase [Vicinamibacterales bacterium]
MVDLEAIVNTYQNHIGGQDVAAADGRTFTGFNPTTGDVWGTFSLAAAAEVDRAVRAASDAFRTGPWGRLSPTRRGRLLMKWGDAIAAHADRIATIETGQNGKLFAEMRAQARITQDWLYYFGGLADKIEGSVIPLDRQTIFNYTLREPLGVVGVITPWNSPTFIAIMSLAPALAAGNTIVLKPSEITSASAIELARLAEAAGMPPGVINVVTGFRETGEALVDHPLVAKVSFTGSVAAGRAIAARAGQRLVGCLLELGGKSPNIVFDDASLEQAEAGVLAGIFAAAGQTCVAGSRAYIQRSIYDRFVDRLVARAQQIALGDPMRAETQMGPVATKMQLEKDESMVQRAVEEGAAVLCGGGRPSLAEFPGGYFYEPTIVQQAGRDSFLMRNEVFGPVLAVTPFKDEAEVLTLANDTEFGLAAGIWTHDVRRVHKMARALEAGTVWVNTYRALTFNSPFGGYKSSGIGRQNGIEAVSQYLQTKSVWCELGDEVQDPFVMKLGN